MSKKISIKADKEYTDSENYKISFPNGTDGGVIVLYDEMDEGTMTFYKE